MSSTDPGRATTTSATENKSPETADPHKLQETVVKTPSSFPTQTVSRTRMACTPLSAERKRLQAQRQSERLREAQAFLDEVFGNSATCTTETSGDAAGNNGSSSALSPPAMEEGYPVFLGMDEDAFMEELVDGVILCDYVNRIMVRPRP